MPLYEYVCRACGKKFDRFRYLTQSDTEVDCPECGTKEPERLFSAFSSASGCSSGGSSGYT